MEGYKNNEFHGYGGNTASGFDRGFDEPLNWNYAALQNLEWEGTFISLPPKLTSLSDNFNPNVLPLSETIATLVPPMLPPVEDVTYDQPNPQDQLPALQNINGEKNTDDYRKTQFRVSTKNQVAPLLHAEVELPGFPQDQMPALQNNNSRNNTDDYQQTHFRVSTANHVAPMLPAEVELSGSQINHSLSQKDISSKSKDCKRWRWSEEEHGLFLCGLQKYGKSDWINISRFIKTRTPTQVASHAQKYFIRQASRNKGKRRSIHDIVLPDNGPVLPDNGPVPHRIHQHNRVSFPTLDGPVPHHIHHQNGVSFPTLDGPVPYRIYQQNGVSFRTLDGPIPHHIHHQNGVSFPTLDGPVPHRIYQQNGVSFLTLDGPVPHRIYQQNGVSFPTLDGPMPHHIHHQNGVPFPNSTKQQLYKTHLAVFRYMNQQNWFLDQCKKIYQK